MQSNNGAYFRPRWHTADLKHLISQTVSSKNRYFHLDIAAPEWQSQHEMCHQVIKISRPVSPPTHAASVNDISAQRGRQACQRSRSRPVVWCPLCSISVWLCDGRLKQTSIIPLVKPVDKSVYSSGSVLFSHIPLCCFILAHEKAEMCGDTVQLSDTFYFHPRFRVKLEKRDRRWEVYSFISVMLLLTSHGVMDVYDFMWRCVRHTLCPPVCSGCSGRTRQRPQRARRSGWSSRAEGETYHPFMLRTNQNKTQFNLRHHFGGRTDWLRSQTNI